MTWTNKQKSVVGTTWDQDTLTWNQNAGTWDFPTLWVNTAKSSSTIVNISKSSSGSWSNAVKS